MSDWISVEDRLPERKKKVLLYANTIYPEITVGRLDDWKKFDNIKKNVWIVSGGGYYEMEKSITHWMPLPEPPKSEESK